MTKRSRQQLGKYGEDVAAAFVELKGWKVVERNWRCREGELDLIARPDPETIVFVEVKSRSGDVCGPPEGAVTPRKLVRLRRLAAAWLVASGEAARHVRIDVIAVTTGGERGRSVKHFEAVG
jgi:putative endonuclease